MENGTHTTHNVNILSFSSNSSLHTHHILYKISKKQKKIKQNTEESSPVIRLSFSYLTFYNFTVLSFIFFSLYDHCQNSYNSDPLWQERGMLEYESDSLSGFVQTNQLTSTKIKMTTFRELTSKNRKHLSGFRSDKNRDRGQICRKVGRNTLLRVFTERLETW